MEGLGTLAEGSRPRGAPVALLGVALAAVAGIAGTTGEGASRVAALCAGTLLLLPLAIGLRALRRGNPRSVRAGEVLLLAGVPIALALGGLLRPAAPLDPVVLLVETALLLGYLAVVAHAHAPAAGRVEQLPQVPAPLPPRYRRRLRVYRTIEVLAALAFALPLGVAIREGATGSATPPRILFAAAGLLGALACRAFLIDALDRHLQGDPALGARLAHLRRHARQGRPAPAFYVAAVIALLAMGLYAARHALGWSAG